MSKKQELIDVFISAVDNGDRFVAVEIEMDGFPSNEVIINPAENIDAKLRYYSDTYNDDLIHKYSPTIRIVGFASGDSYEDIENEILG